MVGAEAQGSGLKSEQDTEAERRRKRDGAVGEGLSHEMEREREAERTDKREMDAAGMEKGRQTDPVIGAWLLNGARAFRDG